MKTIAIIGAFDTKAEEYHYIIQAIQKQGMSVFTINTGVLGSTDLFPVDVEADELADAAGADIKILREEKDRGAAMKIMCTGAASIVKQRFEQHCFDGIFGMGTSFDALQNAANLFIQMGDQSVVFG